jgi:hypothetical protein
VKRKAKVRSRDEEWMYRARLKETRMPDVESQVGEQTWPQLEQRSVEEMGRVARQLGLPLGDG